MSVHAKTHLYKQSSDKQVILQSIATNPKKMREVRNLRLGYTRQ
jgi:hypothetical protein